MPNAGTYSDAVVRLVCTRVKSADNGQEVETFADGASLWTRIEIESGRRQEDYGAEQTGVQATIRVRNFPALTALDRFRDGDGQIYIIETIRPGDDEWICDCHAYDALEI